MSYDYKLNILFKISLCKIMLQIKAPSKNALSPAILNKFALSLTKSLLEFNSLKSMIHLSSFNFFSNEISLKTLNPLRKLFVSLAYFKEFNSFFFYL